MSWQAYTDNLIGTSKVDKAVIYSRAGDAVWATSGGLSLQPNEIGEIVQGFDNPAGLQSNGLHIQGQKFMLLRADDRSIYGRHDAEGVVCVRTKQTVIIAHYPPTVQAGEATKIVEQLADYLIGVQY
ncbi:BBM_1a_G0049750.mRNA.1.CDS.1 [Saccharomyces cerevisiae]|nr:BBM_1a_G0049750.mRNA.1.CDS.1 [Saccharomyces cerevisiae]CAI7339831.1 BBM_1a_G0049750.mRNA.1.CDS.1 [Saccharomyces cerevisiae]